MHKLLNNAKTRAILCCILYSRGIFCREEVVVKGVAGVPWLRELFCGMIGEIGEMVVKGRRRREVLVGGELWQWLLVGGGWQGNWGVTYVGG